MNFSERLADLMRKKGVNWKTISEELHIGLNLQGYYIMAICGLQVFFLRNLKKII